MSSTESSSVNDKESKEDSHSTINVPHLSVLKNTTNNNETEELPTPRPHKRCDRGSLATSFNTEMLAKIAAATMNKKQINK